MVQKVIKYGDGLAVILPRESASLAGIDVGTLVETKVENGRLVVQSVEVKETLTEEERAFLGDVYKKREQVFKKLGE